MKKIYALTFCLFIVLCMAYPRASLEHESNPSITKLDAPSSSGLTIDGNAAMDVFFASNSTSGTSWEDAYIFDGLTFDEIEIKDSSRYLIFRNCVITSATVRAQIYLNNATNVMIDGCHFNCNSSNLLRRAFIWATVYTDYINLIVQNSDFISEYMIGVHIRNNNPTYSSVSRNVLIFNNTMEQCLHGADFYDIDYVEISQNILTNTLLHGIVSRGNNVNITNNTVAYASNIGIAVYSSNTTISKNIVSQCNEGIQINGTSQVNATENIISQCASYGIRSISSNFINISSNILENMQSQGIRVNAAQNATIQENEFENCADDAMYVSSSSNITIFMNTIIDSSYAFTLISIANVTISYNIIIDANLLNLYLFNSNSVNITSNSFQIGSYFIQSSSFIYAQMNWFEDYTAIYPNALNDGTYWLTEYEMQASPQINDTLPLMSNLTIVNRPPKITPESKYINIYTGDTRDIVFYVYDKHINTTANYTAYLDGNPIQNGLFVENNITVTVSNIEVGDHILLVIMDDGYGKRGSASIEIISFANDAPIITDYTELVYFIDDSISIAWNVIDDTLRMGTAYYNISINGTEAKSGIYNGFNFSITISGLNENFHNLTAAFFDGYGKNTTDYVILVANQRPLLTDIYSFIMNQSDAIDVIWTIYDNTINSTGAYYTIEINGTLVASESFIDYNISYTFTNLDIGKSEVNLTFYDGFGRSFSDLFNITALEDEIPDEEPNYAWVYYTIGGGIVAVGVVAYFIYRNKAKNKGLIKDIISEEECAIKGFTWKEGACYE